MDTRSHNTEQLEGASVSRLTDGSSDASASVTQTVDQHPLDTTSKNPTGLQDLTPTDFEQLIYANALAKRPSEAEQAFDLMAKYNVTASVRALNHLMDAYANTSNLERTIATFKKMDDFGLKPDIFSYGSLIKAFVTNKRLDDAFVIFEKLKKSSMIPSQPIFANLISGCLKENKVEKAWEVFDSMRLSFHQPDEVSFTLMLHACAKVRRDIEAKIEKQKAN